MSWFNRKSKRRSTILKRRGVTAERLIFIARRFGIALAAFVLIGWFGAWFFMSDASTRTAEWANQKVLGITADAGFQVKDILVEGRRYTDAEALKAIINTEKGDPIFGFNPSDAQKMISRISWVRSVQVERRFPGTIYVKLQERTPMALWQRDKRLSLIDTEGEVLTDHKIDRFKDYIVVVGGEVPTHAPEFLKLLISEPEIVSKIDAANLKSGRRWDLVLKSGAVVKLPEEDLVLAFRRLAQMHEEKQILDKDVKTIDVREPARILVRTHPGAVQQYQAGYQKTNTDGDAI